MCMFCPCYTKKGNKKLNQIIDLLERQTAILHGIYELLKKDDEGNAVHLVFWKINPDGSRSKLDMAFILTDIQQVDLAITAVDAKGNPAKLDGAPTWLSSDESILTVQPSVDGMSAVVIAVGPIGTAQISVTADADLSPSVTQLLGILDVEVVASDAVNVTIVPGTPTVVGA